MTQRRPIHLRLGLRYGLLIGLALALGTWGIQFIALCTAHVRLLYPPLILGTLALMFLGGLGGWLAARFENTLACGLTWTLTGSLMALVVGHLPYEGHSLTVWLADRRYWGLSIYPFNESAHAGEWLAGFFVVVTLTLLGLFQNYRLESILMSEADVRGRLSGVGWLRLALPLPLVLVAGLIADDIVNKPLRVAPQTVHEAIRTGRTYSGDLFELSRRSGVNYNAISAVRDQMSGDYTLFLGEMEAGTHTALVVVHFGSGAWINCWVVGGQLSSCYDASSPYRQGFSALLTTGETPPGCRACQIQVNEDQRAWLLARSANLGGAPRVTRVAQWGGHVLMRAQSPVGVYAIECRFQGIREVRLEKCWEVKGSIRDSGDQTVGFKPHASKDGGN